MRARKLTRKFLHDSQQKHKTVKHPVAEKNKGKSFGKGVKWLCISFFAFNLE